MGWDGMGRWRRWRWRVIFTRGGGGRTTCSRQQQGTVKAGVTRLRATAGGRERETGRVRLCARCLLYCTVLYCSPSAARAAVRVRFVFFLTSGIATMGWAKGKSPSRQAGRRRPWRLSADPVAHVISQHLQLPRLLPLVPPVMCKSDETSAPG
jgi:hypothetical protein